jgi:hypothetical protein
MSIQDVFMKLDDKSIESIIIDESGCLGYFGNMPVWKEKLALVDNDKYMNGLGYLYTVPHTGDLLLNIEITGKFWGATMFQYDWTGSHKIKYDSYDTDTNDSYDTDNNVTMAPFPDSGYPLLQVGKQLYVEVMTKPHNDIDCIATYAFLDTVSRKRLMEYREGNHGVKVRHENGDVYQVLNMHEWGYSPNYLALL